MVLRTTVEQADGPVPVTILALDGELDASSYERVIDTVRADLRRRWSQAADGPDRPGVHLELRPRGDAFQPAADAGRGAARPGAGLGRPARDRE